MLTNIPKNQKTSSGFDNLYINNWQENRNRIETDT